MCLLWLLQVLKYGMKFKKILIALVLGAALIFVAKKYWIKDPVQKMVAEQQYFDVTEQVGTGTKDTITVYPGETALGLITKSHLTQTKEYSFGTLVESIDNVKGGTDGKYWLFYVNGKQATVGAGDYKLQSGDSIEWRLE